MSWLDGMRHRLRSVLGARAYQEELDEEMRFHLELDAVQQGDADEARRRFGNRTWYAEEVRRTTWLRHLDAVRQDLGYAWRAVLRTPGVTIAVVTTLALGIGVNAATFSVLDMLYLRPPGGVEQPESLRRLWFEHPQADEAQPWTTPAMNYPMYRAITQALGDSTNIAAYTQDNALRLGPQPLAPGVRGIYATASYFSVLGVRPSLGRVFTTDEDRMGSGVPVAVVSHAFWQRRLGGDSAILGRTIPIGSDRFTVVGVVGPEFDGLDLQAVDVWMPLSTMKPPFASGRWWEVWHVYRLRAIQRMTPRLSDVETARLATRAAREANRELRGEHADTTLRALTGSIIEARGPGKPGQELVISTRLGGVALIVLVIACANVVNLLLARAVGRRREVALRLALGISRARLIRLLTVETLLLAALAGAGALLIGSLGGDLLRTLLMPDIEWTASALHWRVFLFTIGVAAVAGLVAGIVPAVQASDPELVGALKDGAHTAPTHRSRLRSTLVVAQAALSVVLLVGSMLFVHSLRNVQTLDIGFDADRLLFGSVEFAIGAELPSRVAAEKLREVEERLANRPGVEAVARSNVAPMHGFSFVTFFLDGAATDSLGSRSPTTAAVSPDFLRAAGIRLLRGRGFTGNEHGGSRNEVVVNDAAARLLWPDRDAVGRCMQFIKPEAPCYTVVGIVENVRRGSVIEESPEPHYYLPIDHMPPGAWFGGDVLVVRARAEAAEAATTEMRAALLAAFPSAQPRITPMTANLEPQYRPWRLGASLFAALGLLALMVTLVGVYSTVSYGVSQRTHEFGVRIALGARIGDVLRQVVGEGLRTVAIGVALGIVLALAAGRLVAALLYGVSASDPAVMLLVALVLLAVAALAAVIPAWRAARVDPVTALRAE